MLVAGTSERHVFTIANVVRQPTQVDLATGRRTDVVDDPHSVTTVQPLGAQGRAPRRIDGSRNALAGVEGQVEVGVDEPLEGVGEAARRKARLRSGDVEAHDARVAVAQGELGDLCARSAWRIAWR